MGTTISPSSDPTFIIVVADALRPEDASGYYPGEAVLCMADIVVVNKVNSATSGQVERAVEAARGVNARAPIVRASQRGRKPPLRSTSVLIEEVHDFREIMRREWRVDRGRLDVGVPRMLLDRAEVAAGPLEQLDTAGVTKRKTPCKPGGAERYARRYGGEKKTRRMSGQRVWKIIKDLGQRVRYADVRIVAWIGGRGGSVAEPRGRLHRCRRIGRAAKEAPQSPELLAYKIQISYWREIGVV